MARVYLMCGMICSGKSTYAQQLRLREKAVVLSTDEITLALFGQDAGANMDMYVARLAGYLYEKSLEILETGTSVILDLGFWKRADREKARAFYAARHVQCEFHGMDVDTAEWKRRVEKRNEAVLAGKTSAYYVDEGLAAKALALFEKPGRDEMDVWVRQEEKTGMENSQEKNAMERVAVYEAVLDRAETAADALETALEQFEKIRPELKSLEAYYTGEDWKADYDRDAAGGFPEGMKRGVLSEDAVYDLLERCRALREKMAELAEAEA